MESQLDTATKKSPTLDLGISLENGFFKLQDNTQPPTISFPMHPCLFLNYIYIYVKQMEECQDQTGYSLNFFHSGSCVGRASGAPKVLGACHEAGGLPFAEFH